MLKRKYIAYLSKTEVILFLTALIYGGTLCYLKIAAFHHGFAHADLTLYQNILWNTNFKDLWLYSDFLFYEFGYSGYLSEHFSPTLLLLVPIYKIWSSPYLLLLMQGLTPLATAFLFYIYSQKINVPKNIAVITIISYCVHPTVVLGILDIGNGFHHDALIPPFLILSLVLYSSPRAFMFYFTLVLTLGLKENVPFIVLCAAAIAFLTNTDRRRAFISGLVALAFLIIGLVIIPDIYDFKPQHASGILTRVLTEDISITSVVSTLLANKELFWYVSAFLSPLTLLTIIPELAIYHYSDYDTFIFSWHGLPSITIVVIASMMGFKQWTNMTAKFNSQLTAKIYLLYLMITISMGTVYSLVKSRNLIYDITFTEKLHSEAEMSYFQGIDPLIPDNARLVVQHVYGPHAANRKYLQISEHAYNAEYLYIDLDLLRVDYDTPLIRVLLLLIKEEKITTVAHNGARFFLFKASEQANSEKPQRFFKPLTHHQLVIAKQTIITNGMALLQ